MQKKHVERLARALLGPRAPEVTPDFAATVPWAPTPVDGEIPIWHESSYDLRRGMDMSEEPLETLPGELRDFFPKR